MKSSKTIEKEIIAKSASESEAKKYLSRAFNDQDVNLIKLIINNYPKLANEPMRKGLVDWYDYPLELTISIKNVHERHEIINLLLVNGANIEQISTGFLHTTSLEIAFVHRQIETFELLRKLGADLHKTNIQERVDGIFDRLKLEKDDKYISANFKAIHHHDFQGYNYYIMTFNNYNNIQKILMWYHSLSEKYKDDLYKNKINNFLLKAKQEAVTYMLVLQDELMNYLEVENVPESTLMLKNKKLDQEEKDITDAEIELLQNSIMNYLDTKHNGLYHIAILMNYQNHEILKDVVKAAENYLLTTNVQQAIDNTLRYYQRYKEDPLMIHIKKEEKIIYELENKLQSAATKIEKQENIIKMLCEHAKVKINSGEIVLPHNSDGEDITITGYSWQFVEQL